MNDPNKIHRISADSALKFVESILIGNGCSKEDAKIISECLIEADLHGVDTHGANRIPSYMERIRKGVLNPKAGMEILKATPVVHQIDAKNGFGFVAATKGMKECIESAKVFGIGMCSIKNSNHFGMSGAFVRQANKEGFMSLVFTNSSPALPCWGSKSKLMGVSPIACGGPGGKDGIDFVLDMAPSVAARGKIYRAKRRNELIPDDWAIDKDGNPTTDPNDALEGSMLPMGGPKGSALSIMMDVFSGVLSGSAFAGHVVNPYHPTQPANVGHFLMAIKPDLFMSLEDFKARLDYLYQRVVNSEKRPGTERIYFPGEIEHEEAKKRQIEGIPWTRAEIEALNEEADKVNVAHLVWEKSEI